MKYFTPDLYIRGQSPDEGVLDEAERLWEEAGERYLAALTAIRPALPPGVRHVLDSYYLHDAVVLGMGRQGNAFVLVLQLDTPPHSLLTFTYDLVGEPVIRTDVLPPELRTPPEHVEWMYDEVEVIPGQPPVCCLSVLLSNGWELQLRFRDVAIQETQAILPVPRNGTTAIPGGTLPRTA